MNVKGRFVPLIVCTAIIAVLLSSCHIRPAGPAEERNLVDTDIDGIPNVNDADIDNDGKINIIDPDIDGDNLPNNQDPDIDGDLVANIDDIDIDGDGTANTLDIDIDGDGFVNSSDDDLDGDNIANTTDIDIDGDGVVNGSDPDIDNDGIVNTDDTIPGGTGTVTGGTGGIANTGNDTNTGNTDDDVYVDGIGVVTEDTVGFTFTVPANQGSGTLSKTELLDLTKVRSELDKNDIALSTFQVSNLSIIAPASSFVAVNSATKIVVKVSYLDENGSTILAMESADKPGLAAPVLTIADLAAGLDLGDEIRGNAAGFGNFITIVKDESKKSVETVVDITFLDPPVGSGDLDVDFMLRAIGKKAL